MDLIPAIDLLDGQATRLVQGDYARRAAVVEEPAVAVAGWVRAGVRWLHIVDLAGARAGRPVHLDFAGSLVRAARAVEPDVRVELGGGLRTLDDVQHALDAGVDLAVLGTAAIENRGFLATCVERWPRRIAVSIDARGERVAVDGWRRSTEADASRLAAEMASSGAAQITITDVERDGTRSGPNRELLGRVREAIPDTRLVAAGGIGSADDLRQLSALGIDGAIVGLALIDGSLSITDALDAVAGNAVVS